MLQSHYYKLVFFINSKSTKILLNSILHNLIAAVIINIIFFRLLFALKPLWHSKLRMRHFFFKIVILTRMADSLIHFFELDCVRLCFFFLN